MALGIHVQTGRHGVRAIDIRGRCFSTQLIAQQHCRVEQTRFARTVLSRVIGGKLARLRLGN